MPSGKQCEMLFKLNAQANSGFKGTFSQAQGEFAKLGSEIQSLNRAQADISAYQKQSAAIDSTKAKIANLTKQHELLSQQIQNTTGDTSGLEREQLKLEQRMASAQGTLERQEGRLSAASQRLEEAGVNTADLAGESARLSTRIEELSKEQEQAARSAAASALFGKEAMSGMLAVINASEKDFQSLTQNIENSAGAAERMAKIKLDNLQGDLTLLQSATDGLSLTIGEEFMPQIRGLVQIGTSVITFVNELIDQHPVLTKVVLGAAGAVGVLTAGVVSYNAAQKVMAAVNLASLFTGPVGPILAVGAAIGGVVAGIIGLAEAANEGKPKIDELTEAARGLDQAIEDASTGFEASQTEIEASAGLADRYITRLEKLDGVTGKTREQQEEYHATLALLAETVPELAGAIDLETDSIEGGTEALRAQTEEWERNARAQAYQEALAEIYSAQAAAELEREKSLIDVRNAEAELRDMEAERTEILRQMQEMEDDPSLYDAGKYYALEERIRDLNDNYWDLDESLGTYQGALDESNAKLDEAKAKTESYTQAMGELLPPMDSAASAAETMTARNEGLWASIEEVGVRAGALCPPEAMAGSP